MQKSHKIYQSGIISSNHKPALPDSIEDKVEAYSNLEDWK
jgi:hypothetical protein